MENVRWLNFYDDIDYGVGLNVFVSGLYKNTNANI